VSDQENTSSMKPCPHCAGTELYARRLTSGSDPYLLKGLGRFLRLAEFDVVVCAGCGLTRFFAEPEARRNARSNAAWKRL
jgi:predicted nucleic-acid-binding Zn-ribbon protein